MGSIDRKAESSNATKRLCVTRLSSVQNKDCLIWKICEFNLCHHEKAKNLTSPEFPISGEEKAGCYVSLFTKGFTRGSADEYISLAFYSTRNILTNVEFSIVNSSGEKVKTQTLTAKTVGWQSVPKFISWNELMKEKDQLLPRDELTISCVVSAAKKIERKDKCEVARPQGVSNSSQQDGRLNSDLRALLNDQRSTDVVLRLDRMQIPAHKMVLACRSPVFASMFELDSHETSTADEVVITDVEPDVFKELIRYVYTDEVSHRDVDFSLKLLEAAHKYALMPLKARCVDYIRGFGVSEDNVLDILKTADACEETELSRECMGLIVQEFSSVKLLSKWIAQMKDCPGVLDVIKRHLT